MNNKILILVAVLIILVFIYLYVKPQGDDGTYLQNKATLNFDQSKEINYLPLAIGNYWTYDAKTVLSDRAISFVFKYEIGRSEKIDNKETFVVAFISNGTKSAEEFYYIDGKKLMNARHFSGGNMDFIPHQLLYDFGSNEWSWQGKWGGEVCTLEGQFLGNEKVSVPAGEFDTLKLRTELKCSRKDANSTITDSVWFARDIGIVKEQYYLLTVGQFSSVSTNRDLVLRDYKLN